MIRDESAGNVIGAHPIRNPMRENLETLATTFDPIDLANFKREEAMIIDRRAFLGTLGQAGVASALIQTPVRATGDLEQQLADAAAHGGGDVIVSEGQFQVGKTLVVGKNVNLYLSRAVRLVAAANVPMVEVKIGGRLTGGGTLDFSQLHGFSDAAIVIQGVPRSDRNDHTVIGDLLIRGGGQPGSKGIHLIASEAGSRITWVKMWGIDVIHAHTGIQIDVTSTGAPVTWVNANSFDVDIQQPVFGFVLNAKGADARVTANWFRGQLQTFPETQRAVYCEGDFNRFDLFVWDWVANVPNGTAAEFTATSRRNEFSAPSLRSRDVVDHGSSNKIVLD